MPATQYATQRPEPGNDAPLLALIRDASNLNDAREALEADVLAAREFGFTWREIADAVGMTQLGVTKLAKRAREASETATPNQEALA